MAELQQVTVRETVEADTDGLLTILGQIELFPPEMLPELIAPHLQGQADEALWLTALKGETVVGFACAVPEPLSGGVWNMLALGVLPSAQRGGVGAALTRAMIDKLTEAQRSILIIDTSSGDAFVPARALYAHLGFREEARIQDYWGPGDDKVIFWKSLRG